MTSPLLAAVLGTSVLAMPAIIAGATHDKSFWDEAKLAGYAVPSGESADALSEELAGYLGNADPAWRDDVGYTFLARWLAVAPVISDAQARRLADRWIAALASDAGATPILLRSFSALCLSVALARENQAPYLGEDRYHAAVAAAIRYLPAEHDLRGFDPSVGWVHATAHTADVLKFAGRNRQLTRAEQDGILSAVAARVRTADVSFAFGEDERLARAVQAVILREDADPAAFDAWLEALSGLARFPDRPTVESLACQQNARHVLTSLHAQLSGVNSERARGRAATVLAAFTKAGG